MVETITITNIDVITLSGSYTLSQISFETTNIQHSNKYININININIAIGIIFECKLCDSKKPFIPEDKIQKSGKKMALMKQTKSTKWYG